VPRLRLSLTIAGTARRGAYEGGALAALIVASTTLGEETLVIDSMASASAGSINELLTARALLGGIDPVRLFDAAWVHNDSFELPDGSAAETSQRPNRLIGMVVGVLGPHGIPSGPTMTRQREPVRLSLPLSNLDDLVDDPARSAREAPRTVSMVLDWYSVALTTAATPPDYLVLARAAAACASDAEAPDQLRRADAAPDDGPLGRVIDLAEDIESDDERLYLVLRPDGWNQPADDLTRLEKTNSRVEWIECADVSCEAQRIMTERWADRSDDYAALLDSLVRSTAGSPARSNRLAEELTSSLGGPCTIESRQDEFALGYRTMRSWLANRLQAYLSAIDLSTALDRVDEEYDRVDRTEPRRAGTRSARTSCNGMAALGH
jgi:hypothetical protein